MGKDITLVVMAAGMGSRFGGLKQLEPIGKNGEVILDFSVYDAVKAGFNKVVFVIKHAIEDDFKRIVGSRIEKRLRLSTFFRRQMLFRRALPALQTVKSRGEPLMRFSAVRML